jgi:hypothetical protein
MRGEVGGGGGAKRPAEENKLEKLGVQQKQFSSSFGFLWNIFSVYVLTDTTHEDSARRKIR